jgi:hypothetical protein
MGVEMARHGSRCRCSEVFVMVSVMETFMLLCRVLFREEMRLPPLPPRLTEIRPEVKVGDHTTRREISMHREGTLRGGMEEKGVAFGRHAVAVGWLAAFE